MATVRRTTNPNLNGIVKGLKDLDGMRGRVGWFESAKYPDGTSVAYVASIQEYGSGPIPPRPFFRPTIIERQLYWAELIAKASQGVITGKRTAYQAMDLLGLQVAGDVRATISKITTPPLSTLTLLARKHRKEGGKITGAKQLAEIDRKGRENGPPDVSGVSTKPLIDTRVLLPTLTNVTDTK